MEGAISTPADEEADVTTEKAWEILDRASQRYLQMPAKEFVQKWESGFFKEHPELAYKAADVALLLPLLSAR